MTQENQTEEIVQTEIVKDEIIPGSTNATRLFGIRDAIKGITEHRERIVNQRDIITDNEGNAISDHLSEAIKDLSVEDLKALSAERVNEIYGEIEVDASMPEDRADDFRKGFLIYLKESEAALATIDEELAKFDTEIQKDQEELDKLIAEFGDLDNFIKIQLDKSLETAEGERQEKLLRIKKAYEEVYHMDFLHEHYKHFSVYNTLREMKSDTLSLRVYGKYKKTLSKLGIKSDVTEFDNLERKFLPEKYHELNNAFLYSIIKYFGYKKNPDRIEDGIFLVQLSVCLKYLFTDTFKTAEDKERFTAAICRVLDLYIQS